VKKKLITLIIVIFTAGSIFPSVLLEKIEKQNIPSFKFFNANKEFIRDFKYRKITVAEYLTDPIILYASLWGCFGLTLPLWETNAGLDKSDKNYWEYYDKRGFDKLVDNEDIKFNSTLNMHVDESFVNRMKMEPFASGRIDPITKVWNNGIAFRNDIYAKNVIEPIYFTYLTLYMRSKNYHPAIMIAEIMLLSCLYEFTIRPFYLNASFEQLLKNPGISIIVGILFDELSTYLLSTPYKGLHVLAYILNPFNSLPTARVHPMLFFDPYRKTASIEAIIKM